MSNWKIELGKLFAATVNQQTLEEAATMMVGVSAKDLAYHTELLSILNAGIATSNDDEVAVIEAINRSGYQVSSIEEARELLQDLLSIYEERYVQAIRQ